MPQNKPQPQNLSPKTEKGFLDPAKRLPNKEQELRELSLDELKERFLHTYQKEAILLETDDKEKQKEELIIDILNGSPAAPAPRQQPEGAPLPKAEKGDKKVKSKDGRDHIIKEANLEKVTVRQVVVQELNGGIVEVPNTEQIQTYDPDYFQKLLDDKFFSESRMRIEILHDPR